MSQNHNVNSRWGEDLKGRDRKAQRQKKAKMGRKVVINYVKWEKWSRSKGVEKSLDRAFK